MDVLGNRIGSLGDHPLRPDGPVGPDVDFFDGCRCTRADDLDTRAEADVAVPWLPIWVATFISAATSRMRRASSTDQVSGFWVKQCFPFFMARNAGRGVAVVGNADGHRVDLVPHLVEHFAIVVEPAGVFENAAPFLEVQIVDVTQSDRLP